MREEKCTPDRENPGYAYEKRAPDLRWYGAPEWLIRPCRRRIVHASRTYFTIVRLSRCTNSYAKYMDCIIYMYMYIYDKWNGWSGYTQMLYTYYKKSSPFSFLWLLGQMLTDYNTIWSHCCWENLQPNDTRYSFLIVSSLCMNITE